MSRDNLIKALKGFCLFLSTFILLLFSPWIFLTPWSGRAAYLCLGRTIAYILFFWPQLTLLPNGIQAIQEKHPHSRYHFTHGKLVPFAILFWVIIGIVFSWFLRDKKFRIKLTLVIPLIAVAMFVAHYIMYWAGYTPYLEGP